MSMSLVVYPGSERFRTREDGRDTRHSFSFGRHYHPANLGFGRLIALNDDRLAPHAGYPDHGHSDIEIVTWVVQGALHHTDADGTAILGPGSVLAQSAGDGIRHAELAGDGPTRFVQTWLRPDSPGGAPSRAHVRAPELGEGLVRVVGQGGLPVGVRGAELRAGTLPEGAALELPDGYRHHLLVAGGGLTLPDGSAALADGDALRASGGCGPLHATASSLLLVWTLPPDTKEPGTGTAGAT